MAKTKMTKDVIPEGFTIPMAVVDLLPCLLFALASVMLGIRFENNILMYIGAAISFIGGIIKCLWKFIVVVKHKNVWWMFLQMRMTMPLGYLLLIIGFVIACFTMDVVPFFASLLNPFIIISLIIGILGMAMMIVFAAKLDSADPKSNWIEQICNSVSQFGFFVAFLLALLL